MTGPGAAAARARAAAAPSSSAPGAWGSSARARSTPTSSTRRASCACLRGRHGHGRSTSGSGGGVPGLVLGVARPDLHLVLLDARATALPVPRGRRASAWASTPTVVEGRAEVVGHGPLPGRGRRGGGPELRPAGGHRRVRRAPAPGRRPAGRQRAPGRRDADRWPADGAGRSSASVVGAAPHAAAHPPGPRAAIALPGRASPAATGFRPSGRCSEAVFHVEHAAPRCRASGCAPRSRVPRGTWRRVLAPAGRQRAGCGGDRPAGRPGRPRTGDLPAAPGSDELQPGAGSTGHRGRGAVA